MRSKFCVARNDDLEQDAGGAGELLENILFDHVLQVAQSAGQLFHKVPGVLNVSIIVGHINHDAVTLNQQIVLTDQTVEDRIGVDIVGRPIGLQRTFGIVALIAITFQTVLVLEARLLVRVALQAASWAFGRIVAFQIQI